MRSYVALVTMLLLAGGASLAQDFDHWSFYGAYQYSRVDSHAAQDALNREHALNPSFPALTFGQHLNFNGWDGGLQEDVVNWFGVVIDVSGSYGHNRIQVGTCTVTVSGTTAAYPACVARTNMSFYTFMGGPQFTLRRSDRVQPFARGLIGGAWFNSSANLLSENVPLLAEPTRSDQGFSVGGGLGADFFVSRHVGIRVAGDYIHSAFFNDGQNNYRGTAGLVYRF